MILAHTEIVFCIKLKQPNRLKICYNNAWRYYYGRGVYLKISAIKPHFAIPVAEDDPGSEKNQDQLLDQAIEPIHPIAEQDDFLDSKHLEKETKDSVIRLKDFLKKHARKNGNDSKKALVIKKYEEQNERFNLEKTINSFDKIA